jgi:hypothetical protein
VRHRELAQSVEHHRLGIVGRRQNLDESNLVLADPNVEPTDEIAREELVKRHGRRGDVELAVLQQAADDERLTVP